ncbi:hypothetical protein [Streptomyces alkaliterrae]|uniref:Uncharacterized protein n=1 Tax=Streptomyces alkaliterrae TaxID=2213162 RepID=A0A5P0YWJ8_9ACTN|nr:hypothetical protein [Streptomyces alkaliterrae]MBB1253110.1 hypothetical protein [Streptomyces alkaliterrae]MBB1259090.1 hypothetical protein [Streptomyces alkaliterrae]MQS04656.1 hypothetical protein [Streptomyces alkaliterrae]
MIAYHCHFCQRAEPTVRTVRAIEQGSGPGGAQRACTGCVSLGEGEFDRPAGPAAPPLAAPAREVGR